MKHFVPTLTLLIGVIVTSCQKDITQTQPKVNAVPLSELSRSVLLSKSPANLLKNISSVDLSQLADSKTSSSFTVSLQNVDGQTLQNDAVVQPNTIYKVVVEGENPARFVVKMAESFDIVQAPSATATQKAVYLIKTTADVSSKLYLSVVPVRLEQNTFTKGRVVGFLLPN